MGFRARALLLFGLMAGSAPAPLYADDWAVTRSEFDPRLLGPLKAELRRKPEDLGLLRRLMGLYRKHSTLDKLGAELLAQAEKSGSGSDYLLAAAFEREHGRFDEASKLLQKAVGRPGGPDAVRVALENAELLLKRSPPDMQAARTGLEGALATLKTSDPRRQKVLRRLIDIYSQGNEWTLAAQNLGALIEISHDVQALRRERAEALTRAGKPKDALEEWRKLAASGGASSAGLIGRAEQRAEAELKVGELCETTHDDMGALAAYRRGLSLLPSQHHLRRELYEHLIALHRKRDELPQLLSQLEKEWPAPNRSFADWELIGRLYDERGDSVSAVNAYRQALRRDPHSIDVRRRLIAILERGGITPEVLHEYEQIIAQAPGDSRAYLELAERLDKAGQRQQALLWLRRAAVRFAGDPSLHSALSDIYQRWGENDLALSEAELLIRLDPHDESYIVNLGEMYWARGKKEKADEIWRRLLTLSANKPVGQARLADVYAEHNMMPQAMELYSKAVKAEPLNLQLRRGLALGSERLSRPSEAVRHWEQIYFAAKSPADRPLRLESRQHLGKLIHRETRLLPSVYSWQRRLQAQFSGMATEKLDAPDLLALGLLVADVGLQLGNAAEAESVLTQLVKRLPEGPLLAEALLALVPVYQQARKLDEAIAALKRAAVLLPDRKRELYAQLATLSLQSYHDEDAVKYAQQAVVDAQGELTLGEIFERRDDNTAAMAAYKRAIELDNRLFRAHMALARLYLGRGELSEAATIYRDVVQKSPQEELVLEAGRKAIDLHEYLGSLGELLRELLPLAYAPVQKPAYRKLLLLLYERYTAPLVLQSRGGDTAAQAELLRLGQSSYKPLAETLSDGDSSEQRLAVTLLAAMGTQGAAPALLNVVLAGKIPEGKDEKPGGPGAESAHRTDIDLRTDALLCAARLEDPRSLPLLLKLVQHREKQLRVGALYGLLRLAGKLDKPPLIAQAAAQFEQAIADNRPPIKALGYLGVGALGAARGLSPKHRAQIQAILDKKQADDTEELPLAAAVHALGQARDRGAVPQLIELLSEGNDEVQRQAAWALGTLGDARAVAPLLRAVFVKSDPVRQMAASALRQLGASKDPNQKPPKLPADRRVNEGLDVARLVADSATFPEVEKPGFWLTPRELAPLVAGLDEALSLHRDVALRTFGDLLGGKESRLPLSLGPLSVELYAAKEADAEAFLKSVAEGLLKAVRKLALEPASKAEKGPAQSGGVAVRDQALVLLGRFAAFSDAQLKKGALGALLETAKSEAPPELVLRAAEVLSGHAAELSPDEKNGLCDRLLGNKERWVRLGALEIAARPGGAGFVSAAALKRAASDSDGFIREAAQRLLAAK